MGEVKQINIKNRSYYFCNGIIDLEKFDARLLKIDKKPHKNIDIYCVGYIAKKKIDDCQNIYNEKYNDVWNEIRDKIKEIGGSECDYEKKNKKIKFISDDNLPLNH